MAIRDESVKIAKISRFRMSHPDYAGLNDREKRRRITLLLRSSNFLVTAEALSSQQNQEQVDGIEGAQSYESTKHQMQAHGIVWVRCNSNSGQPVRDGWPVVFDPVTGTEVTGLPEDNNSMFTEGRTTFAYDNNSTRNLDEYHIVGFALSDPVTANGYSQVPIRLTKWCPQSEGRFLVIGLAGGYTRSSPRIHEDQSFIIDPCPGRHVSPASAKTSWTECRIARTSMKFVSGVEQLNNSMVSEYGVVHNPYPFGFSTGVYVQRNGSGAFLVDRPAPILGSSNGYPCFAARLTGFNSTDFSGNRIVTFTPYSDWSRGLIASVASTGKYKWLPTFEWVYRIHGKIILTPASGSGGLTLGNPWLNFSSSGEALFQTHNVSQPYDGGLQVNLTPGTPGGLRSVYVPEGSTMQIPFSRTVRIDSAVNDNMVFTLVNEPPGITLGGTPGISGEIFIDPIF